MTVVYEPLSHSDHPNLRVCIVMSNTSPLHQLTDNERPNAESSELSHRT